MGARRTEHATKGDLMLTEKAPIIPRFEHYMVAGGGGARLHVVETGNTQGRPLVFLHGFSQSWLAWQPQMCSDLAHDYRLVAVDLRGHGRSDKPDTGYADGALWAEDIAAVLRELLLEQPVLIGWSYGTIVVFDYLREFGEDAVSGFGIVGGITKLGSSEALAALTPQLLGVLPGCFADDAQESVRGLTGLLNLCFARQPSSEDLYPMLGYNVVVPPSVRQALLSREVDNDDLLPTIRKPVLVIHGTQDAIVAPSVVAQHQAGIAHARVRMLEGVGHTPFREDPATFNRHLRTFCESL
jgi:pimeloyl-ACP methyl ester carboxylesterase